MNTDTLSALTSQTDQFIHDELIQPTPADMRRVASYVGNDLKHNWSATSWPTDKVHVENIRTPAWDFDVLLINVPPGQFIPPHTHGVGVIGVSGVIKGELIETILMYDDNRLTSLETNRIIRHDPAAFQGAGLMHMAGNFTQKTDAMIIECWAPKLDFTQRFFRKRSLIINQ